MEVLLGRLRKGRGREKELSGHTNQHQLSKLHGRGKKYFTPPNAPHEDSELQEMKEQSSQASLSAKQAYINALEWTIKHREARVGELEEGIKQVKAEKDWNSKGFALTELYKLVEEKR